MSNHPDLVRCAANVFGCAAAWLANSLPLIQALAGVAVIVNVAYMVVDRWRGKK